MTPRNIWRWITQRLYGALDNIIATLVLAGVAYVIVVISGLLPGLVIPGPIAIPLVIAVIALLPVLIFAVIVVRRSQRKVSLIRPIRLQEPTKPLDLERLGFSQYIEPDPLLVDDTHRFLLVQQTYLIEGYDGKFILRYQGKNVCTQASRLFRDSVVGDSAADTSLMAIQVLDKIQNVPLKWKLLKDEPYEKLIEVYFHQPLNFGDTFDIEFSCQWLGTFTRREDYVFYPIHYYKRGVEKLVGKLVLNAPPSYVEGIRFHEGKAALEPVQPQIKQKQDKFVVTWEIENPQYIYILQYARQDI